MDVRRPRCAGHAPILAHLSIQTFSVPCPCPVSNKQLVGCTRRICAPSAGTVNNCSETRCAAQVLTVDGPLVLRVEEGIVLLRVGLAVDGGRRPRSADLRVHLQHTGVQWRGREHGWTCLASVVHSADKLWWVFVPYSHGFIGQGGGFPTRGSTEASPTPTSMGYPFLSNEQLVKCTPSICIVNNCSEKRWCLLYTLNTSYGGCLFYVPIGSSDKGRGHSLHEELLKFPPPACMGYPLLSNEQLARCTQGICTITTVQKTCGVFIAL